MNFNFLRGLFKRELVTSAFEIVGAAITTAGIAVVFGVGIALIIGGVAVMAFAYLAGK